MTDQTKLTETDGEDELIPVETKPEAHDDGHEDDGDERIAESDDDLDADTTSADGDAEGKNSARDRRAKRRQHQRAARERTEAELRMLREQNQQLLQRMQAVEGHSVQSTANTLEQRYNQVQADIRMAEDIMAKAVEAGIGADVVAAQRIRDDAMAEAQRIAAEHQRVTSAAKQQVAPVAAYAQQWAASNPWFDPSGSDADSTTAKQIDAEMAREGWNPNTKEYWMELTARLKETFEDGDEPVAKGAKPSAQAPRRKAPPTGQSREHVPTSTRKEIYVTPERKQAMIEAGAWDDPVKRQNMLKRYRDYDQTTAR